MLSDDNYNLFTELTRTGHAIHLGAGALQWWWLPHSWGVVWLNQSLAFYRVKTSCFHLTIGFGAGQSERNSGEKKCIWQVLAIEERGVQNDLENKLSNSLLSASFEVGRECARN